MTTYLIGARARYVLLDAENEAEARTRGEICLRDLYSQIGLQNVPIEVQTVRPATSDEIRFWRQPQTH